MYRSFNCVIIDDEPNAISSLRNCLLELHAPIDISGAYSNWNLAVKNLKEEGCDILFLDISLPGINGIDLLKQLPNLAAEVIFVTGHPEYALKAFQYAPTGYLMKPIVLAELEKVVDKAIERASYKRP